MYREGDFNNNTFTYRNTVDGVSVYENPQWLPIGFCVNEELADMEPVSTYFKVQNDFARNATGVQEPIFTTVTPALSALGSGCTASVDSANKVSYTRSGTEKHTVQISFPVEGNMDLYLDISGGNVRQIKVFLDGQQIADDRYQSQAFHIGYLTAGQEVMLECTFNDNGTNSGTITLHAAQFSYEIWNQVYERLSQNPLEVSEWRDGYLRGSVEADPGQILFLSIPKDEGWSVFLDGQRVEPEEVLHAFIAIPMTAGRHDIELKYVSAGFQEGLLLTGISLAGFLLLWIMTVRHKKRKKEEEKKAGETEDLKPLED